MAVQLAFAVFNALAFGAAVFIVAAGLTLIFGILKLLNMAQGAFFMIGAYIAFTIVGHQNASLFGFVMATIAAGVVVAGLGLLTDRLVLVRLRNVDYHYVMIATFALMMVCNGIVKIIWGANFISVDPPEILDGPIQIGSLFISRYTVFVIVAGLLIYVTLEFALHRLWLGKLMQALASDSWMSGVLGLNVPMGLMLSVMAGFFLAGLAGGLLLPNQSLSPSLGESYLLYAFFAVVVGGLGNVRGAFIASVLLGLINSLNTVFLPEIPGLAIYVALALFLLWFPFGLFPSLADGPDAAGHLETGTHGSSILNRRVWQSIAALVFLFLGSMPFWATEGVLFLAGFTLIQGLFALSWNLLFGYAGLASFGHAAFFGMGAYLTGALLRFAPEVPFLMTIGLSAVLGAVVAWAVGSLALRRITGVFLAVLTVSLCEVMRLLISYSSLLGREDGLVNIPRPKIGILDLSSSSAYFWFLLIATGLLVGVLWWIAHGRYGRILSSIRQDPDRATFIGVNVTGVRVAAFMLSGAVAAIAGSLYAPLARIVTLDEVHWLASTQPVLNSMLGGVNSFWGPLVGAATFTVINYATRTMVGLSELIVGVILLMIILLAPNGLVGLWRTTEGWLMRGKRAAKSVDDTRPEPGTVTSLERGPH